MKLDLPAAISSAQDVLSLSEEIRGYSRWFNQNDTQKRLHVPDSGEGRPNLTKPASQLLHDWMVQQPLSPVSLDALIKALADFVATADQLTFTLAAPVSNKLKKTLVGWCRDNISPNILVNFEFSSALLGGLVLRYKSQIFDWSFRRQILASASKFSGILAHV